VAHDIVNLMTAIGGRSRILADRAGGDDARRDAELIQHSAEQAAALSRQLVRFLRTGRAARDLVDVNAVVRSLHGLLRRSLDERIALVLDLDPEAGVAVADAQQIEQVVINLVLNARDAMPDGGEVVVRTGRAGAGEPHLVLEVADTGGGMTEEVRRRALEPFFTTKAPGRGTGLGLPTVAVIARQHGGHVAIDSAPGRGTRVRVSLPAGARVEAEAQGASAS
jgi:signal transduction histidine kinase